MVLPLAAAVLLPGMSRAQQGPLQPVKWSLAIDPASGQVASGGRFTAVVTADIGEGWHVYAPDRANIGPRPVELTIVKNPVFTSGGKIDAPEPNRVMDEAFGQITASYRKNATFRLPVAAAAGAAAGPRLLEIDVTFQACDGNICLPAKTTRLKAAVTVAQ
jgi:DsbC/DsbD-like thiol-disulfide interchange protein